MNSCMAYLKSFDFITLKKSHGKGTDTHTDRQTHTRTCQLLDQLGPEGRVGENILTAIISSQTKCTE